jgi:hypothetical protein
MPRVLPPAHEVEGPGAEGASAKGDDAGRGRALGRARAGSVIVNIVRRTGVI